MELTIHGRARLLGDDVNTDYIISSARKRETLDTAVLKRHLLETVDPAFAASVRPGDLLVAGRNFGCGSAMEIAATVIVAAGIKAVLARTFARTFFRNAINNGLIPVQCETMGVAEGDLLSVVLAGGTVLASSPSTGWTAQGAALPGIMIEILEAGGLVEYIRRHGRWPDGETTAARR